MHYTLLKHTALAQLWATQLRRAHSQRQSSRSGQHVQQPSYWVQGRQMLAMQSLLLALQG